jgi:aspartyl-tRNA(Asn)/glutamyl-tRNA(Gln) amidotransferase subunit A
MDFNTANLHKASELIRRRVLSPVELVESHLARAKELNPTLNAYVTLAEEPAMSSARRAEKEIMDGHYRGPLHGIPVSVKDIFNTIDMPTAFGERRLFEFVPDHDAAIVERLKEAGAIIIGKTNPLYGEYFPEPEFGLTRNPWALDRLPGYSSSGSAAAVASGCDLASVGSDGGGSVRYPAACSGLVGLKPTFGLVSRFRGGVYGIPNDFVGPLTRTARDSATVLQAIAGFDSRDPFSANVPIPDYAFALTGNLRGVRVGIPTNYFWDFLDSEVEATVRRAIGRFGEFGCKIVEVDLPSIDQVNEIHTMLSEGETAAYFQPMMEDFPPETPSILYQRIHKGSKVLATDYIRAHSMRKKIREEIDAAFELADVLATPSSILPPPLLGKFEFNHAGRDWDIGDLASRLSRPLNTTGHPALSMNCGFTFDGLPIGLQLVGPNFGEATLLKVADGFEQATGGVERWPPLDPRL